MSLKYEPSCHLTPEPEHTVYPKTGQKTGAPHVMVVTCSRTPDPSPLNPNPNPVPENEPEPRIRNRSRKPRSRTRSRCRYSTRPRASRQSPPLPSTSPATFRCRRSEPGNSKHKILLPDFRIREPDPETCNRKPNRGASVAAAALCAACEVPLSGV